MLSSNKSTIRKSVSSEFDFTHLLKSIIKFNHIRGVEIQIGKFIAFEFHFTNTEQAIFEFLNVMGIKLKVGEAVTFGFYFTETLEVCVRIRQHREYQSISRGDLSRR